MPQMSPMKWLTIYFIILFISIIACTLIYSYMLFFYFPTKSYNKTHWIWKW